MGKLNFKKSTWLTLLVSGLIFISSITQAQQVATEILDDIVISRSDYHAVIKILFKRPLSYLSHAPENKGNSINIRVNLLGSFLKNGSSALDSESIRIDSDTHLNEVVFEKTTESSGSILLYFTKDVAYDVIHGSDQRSLSIVVYGLD